MKKLALLLAFTCFGTFANAEVNDLQSSNVELSPNAVGWVCGFAFKGTSKGIKVIVKHFKTEAYGVLKCKGVPGQSFTRDVKITIGHHWIGATAGIGYFKLAGVSSEVSLLNCSPDKIFGKYVVAQGEGAIIGGVGAFTAVKVGLPQLAFNISIQLLKGLGVQVGVDKLTITAL